MSRFQSYRTSSSTSRSIEWAYGTPRSAIQIKKVVDVGCGVGGSSRHIAKQYGASGVGLSLSPFQIEKAKTITASENLSQKLEYIVADALNMPFADESFDLSWSMESGEHMPDKSKFMSELARVTAPNGRIIVVTWCHRELKAGESLTKKELKLLKKINDAYYLPDWVPGSTYVELARDLGLTDIRIDDWSEYVEPFWPAVIRSALVPWNFFNLLRSGRTTLRGALATFYMMRGFRKGLIKFVILSAKKS
jgi:tocopherol O-methyltransferase